MPNWSQQCIQCDVHYPILCYKPVNYKSFVCCWWFDEQSCIGSVIGCQLPSQLELTYISIRVPLRDISKYWIILFVLHLLCGVEMFFENVIVSIIYCPLYTQFFANLFFLKGKNNHIVSGRMFCVWCIRSFAHTHIRLMHLQYILWINIQWSLTWNY
jgi:hypothetical protein